jgi:uncharacterized protein (TIGR02996 family)
MPDRDSFLAAIASNPDDDLPRLVFADWLDENGDPDRAAFIRTQIHCSAPGLPTSERSASHNIADDLFLANGKTWYTPFLSALGIDRSQYHLTMAELGWRRRPDDTDVRQLGGGSIRLDLTPRSDSNAQVASLTYEGGFISELVLPPLASLVGCSFANALRLEPVTKLTVPFSGANPFEDWTRITDPVLRRIRELTVVFAVRPDLLAPTVLFELFRDLHLAGVRTFDLVNGNYFVSETVSPDTLRVFGCSSLAYRLDAVRLMNVTEAGVRALCHNREFHWKQLELSGSFGPTTPAHLASTGLANSLRRLALHGGNLDGTALGDSGVAALAAGKWGKLTELSLCTNRISSAGLFQLANASFTPYLESLDLSWNPLVGDGDDLEGLRSLAAALNPDCLRMLCLNNTNLPAVPDFLENLFGDRVLL